MSSAAGDASIYDDPHLCRWTKLDAEESAQSGVDAEEDEWFVLGSPEQGAAEHEVVDVLARRSGRITRVRLGEEVTYCKFRIAESMGVIHEGNDAEGGEASDGANPDDFRWHPSEDRESGGPLAAYRWLVRGESGRAGGAVIVTSRLTGRRTAVFLIREVGTARSGAGLYEFARC